MSKHATKQPTAVKIVSASLEELHEMNHGQLFQFARQNGFDSRAGFSAFKRALLAKGIDYNALREAKNEERNSNIASAVSHEMTFYCDAKASARRFAIIDQDANPVWYGRFFDGEGAEQSAAELEAAKKAVWLAGKIREIRGDEAIRLTLFVDAQWLTTLSGKASILSSFAARYSVDLKMRWIPGRENPADKWTVCSGYQKWQDADTEKFVKPVNS